MVTYESDIRRAPRNGNVRAVFRPADFCAGTARGTAVAPYRLKPHPGCGTIHPRRGLLGRSMNLRLCTLAVVSLLCVVAPAFGDVRPATLAWDAMPEGTVAGYIVYV